MKYLLLVSVIILFLSCDNNEKGNVDYKIQNEKEIVAYIDDNNLNAQKSESGLYYLINKEGDGEQPNANSDVTVAYKGTFLDGSVFDQSDSSGISFNLQQVIKGWTEGITYFKEGGSGLLLVPSHLGYGANDNRGIPGGSVLIFEINLISVD